MTDSAGEDVIWTERRGSALLVTLHGPDRLNAWVPAMGTACSSALASAGANATVRAVDGEEAGRSRLAEFVLPAEEVLDASLAYATDLATDASPTAVAVIKAQVQRHPDLDPETALREGDELMVRSSSRPDVGEGIAAWHEKRPPRSAPADQAAADLDALAAELAAPTGSKENA